MTWSKRKPCFWSADAKRDPSSPSVGPANPFARVPAPSESAPSDEQREPRQSRWRPGRASAPFFYSRLRVVCDHMASPSQKRAWTALTSRLRQVSSTLDEEHWIGGSHVRRLGDNALPGLPLGHLERLRAQLELGAGGELTPTRTGKRRAHAPYSSAAFALNLFGRWLDDEEQLSVCGLRGFEPELRLEHKLKIAHGGGTVNLDVLVKADRLVLGVECKLVGYPFNRPSLARGVRRAGAPGSVDDRGCPAADAVRRPAGGWRSGRGSAPGRGSRRARARGRRRARGCASGGG